MYLQGKPIDYVLLLTKYTSDDVVTVDPSHEQATVKVKVKLHKAACIKSPMITKGFRCAIQIAQLLIMGLEACT
ncbi:hypothetical protein O9929_17250 [Vibrio lentus]|nr:hypothetical protein [Vibrio lentus]